MSFKKVSPQNVQLCLFQIFLLSLWLYPTSFWRAWNSQGLWKPCKDCQKSNDFKQAWHIFQKKVILKSSSRLTCVSNWAYVFPTHPWEVHTLHKHTHSNIEVLTLSKNLSHVKKITDWSLSTWYVKEELVSATALMIQLHLASFLLGTLPAAVAPPQDFQRFLLDF